MFNFLADLMVTGHKKIRPLEKSASAKRKNTVIRCAPCKPKELVWSAAYFMGLTLSKNFKIHKLDLVLMYTRTRLPIYMLAVKVFTPRPVLGVSAQRTQNQAYGAVLPITSCCRQQTVISMHQGRRCALSSWKIFRVHWKHRLSFSLSPRFSETSYVIVTDKNPSKATSSERTIHPLASLNLLSLVQLNYSIVLAIVNSNNLQTGTNCVK